MGRVRLDVFKFTGKRWKALLRLGIIPLVPTLIFFEKTSIYYPLIRTWKFFAELAENPSYKNLQGLEIILFTASE